jgi:hypothetical protein
MFLLLVTDIIIMRNHGQLKCIRSSVLQALENMHTRLSVLEDRYLMSGTWGNPAVDPDHGDSRLHGGNPPDNPSGNGNQHAVNPHTPDQEKRVSETFESVYNSLWLDYHKSQLDLFFYSPSPNNQRRNDLAQDTVNRFFSDELGRSITVDTWKKGFNDLSDARFVDAITEYAFKASQISRDILVRALRMANLVTPEQMRALKVEMRTDWRV